MKAWVRSMSLRCEPTLLSMKIVRNACSTLRASAGSRSAYSIVNRLRAASGRMRTFDSIISISASRAAGVVALTSRSVARRTFSMFGRASSVRCTTSTCLVMLVSTAMPRSSGDSIVSVST